MKSKTQITTICICLMLISITFFSCKKDSSNALSVNTENIENSVADPTTDSLAKGLVGWYTFNGDILDHSGHHNNVVFNTAKPAKGKSGNANTAYQFDGISNYMQVNNSNSLNPQKITLFALFKTQGFYQGTCHGNRLISKGANDADYGRYALGYDDQPHYGYQGCEEPVIDSLENPYGAFGDGQATASGVTGFSKFIHKGKWSTLTYIYNGTYSKLYVNGILISSVKKSTSFTPNSNTPIFFGRNQDPSYPYYFNGIIDEIRIYNRALSTIEVQELDALTKQ
jgi:hypothetical protein